MIPQIIARMQSPTPSVSEGVSALLTRIGQHHPQALIYPLTVAAKDTGAGLTILEKMKEHSQSLVSQASLVSDELIRVAILWSEQVRRRVWGVAEVRGNGMSVGSGRGAGEWDECGEWQRCGGMG